MTLERPSLRSSVTGILVLICHLTGIDGCSTSSGHATGTGSNLETCRGASDDLAVDAAPDASTSSQVPEDVAHDACIDAGLSSTDCDVSRFISRGEALCIAHELSAPTGTEPWRLSIVFASVTRRVIWDVRIVTAPGTAAHYAIDAITGELLRRSTSTAVG